MKKKLGIILLVVVSLVGLQGISRKGPALNPSKGAMAINSLDESPASGQRAMYFAPGGTLTIHGGQATFKQVPVRE